MKCSSLLDNFATIVVIIQLALSKCEGRLCYQCASTKGADNPCLSGMRRTVNDTLDLPSHDYIKNCTAINPSWTKCMIVTKHVNINGKDTLNYFQRECTDGVKLPFKNIRFVGLTHTSNRSTCALNGDNGPDMVCYTFCDTDMCNGPQPPPTEVDPCANFTRWAGSDDYYDYYEDDVRCTGVSIRGGWVALVAMLQMAVRNLA